MFHVAPPSIVFKTPADNRTDYIKRLIGIPGDKIQIVDQNLYINKIKVKKRKIENLFTITDYSGLDPEVANRGLDGGQYPVATTFSLGLNVGF